MTVVVTRTEPQVGVCWACGELTLAVQLRAGASVVLDREELVPPPACPACRSRASRSRGRRWCVACGNGTVQPLLTLGVAVGADGMGRWFKGTQREGEAIHKLHACALAQVG